jgi:hypothetical protein
MTKYSNHDPISEPLLSNSDHPADASVSRKPATGMAALWEHPKGLSGLTRASERSDVSSQLFPS